MGFFYAKEEKLKMKKWLLLGLCALFCSCQSQSSEENKENSMSKNPSVQIRTNKGEIEVELFADKAPDTVKNFLQYVDEKHYNNTIFHRVIDGFMIQGGGFTPQMRQKPTHDPIRNEGDNGEKNMRGTIAMARISDPHSATAQFFINVSDNDFLNYRNQTPGGFGYCVFGKVTKGMEVVDKIKSTPTTTKASMQDVPVETIEILSITKTRS